MKIRTTHSSLFGEQLDVRGQLYKLDERGEVVVSEEHGNLLLAMPGFLMVGDIEQVASEELKDQLSQMDEIALMREARLAKISVIGKSKEQLAEEVAARRKRRKD